MLLIAYQPYWILIRDWIRFNIYALGIARMREPGNAAQCIPTFSSVTGEG
jgi:hypothetical protein